MKGCRRTTLGILAALGVVSANLGLFAFLQNRLGPVRTTARHIVDLFEIMGGGVFPGYRRRHARGLIAAGRFISNGAGAPFSTASVFQQGDYPVLGRFSLGSSNPTSADPAVETWGVALQMLLPNGEQWRMALNNLPVFLAGTPGAFYDYNVANLPDPATGKPDPLKMDAFLARNPDSAQAITLIKAARAPGPTFSVTTFNGLNAFLLVNGAGQRTPVRWRLTPEDRGPAFLTADGPNAVFDDLALRIQRAPARWRLILQIGVPSEDPTDNATLAWPASRQQLEVGVVEFAEVGEPISARARNLVFDPTVLPAGIEISDDPLLAARSAVYRESYRRRSLDPVPPDQVYGEKNT